MATSFSIIASFSGTLFNKQSKGNSLDILLQGVFQKWCIFAKTHIEFDETKCMQSDLNKSSNEVAQVRDENLE